MQNAQDVSLLQYIDRFIFGPTVAFEKQSAYGIAETIDRLTAARLSIWQNLFGFSIGLIGTVDADRISLRWRNPWTGHGLQPYFRGSIISRGDTVTVVGSIGVPWFIKAFIIGWLILFIVALRAFEAGDALGGAPRDVQVLVTAFVPVAIALSFVLPRVLKASDYANIADAIDAAVS